MSSSPLPSALSQEQQIESRLQDKRIAVFLDYDGTLTPIVARPELAQLEESMRAALAALSKHCTVAIISGRSLADVKSLVRLEDIYYAGNHGLEILGPDASTVREQRGVEFQADVASARAAIEPRVADIPGILVEDKGFSLSVHYRQVEPRAVPRIEALVDEVLGSLPRLQKRHGKKVFEIRPCIEWDKGKAILWLIETLALGGEDFLPIYIGDDVTDEDAFVALREHGLGLRVGEQDAVSAAGFSLADTEEVREFLHRVCRHLKARRP